MRTRKKHLYLSIFSLMLGLLYYVFFKPNSYLHIAAAELFETDFGKELDFVILNSYFCDFLWGFSLAEGLIFILGGTLKKRMLCGAIATAYGALWEVLQFAGVISGTGDLVDMLTYLQASILAVMI